MMIEAIVKWAEMRLKKRNDEEAYMQRIVNGDVDSDIPEAELHYELSPMVFNLNDVVRYNLGTDPNYTVLRFKDGDGYMVQIPYQQFKELYVEYTGKSILSIIAEKTPTEQKIEGKEDDLII